MNKTITILSFVMLFFIASCSQSHKAIHSHPNSTSHHKEHVTHWSYGHGETSPAHWAEVETESMCGGEHQSPINIEESKVIPKNDLVKNLTFKYSPRMALSRVANNGHSIQFNFKAGNSILYNGKEFELKQLHFHESSEHTINGKHYPIEIHLVHVSKKGEIAVIGLFGAEGADNQLIETLETFLPIKKGVANDIEQSINLKKFLPKGSAYYSYTGSLTTPPCSEGVNWILFQKPIILSASEVAKMKQDMPSDNFRPTQSLNGRSVYLNH